MPPASNHSRMKATRRRWARLGTERDQIGFRSRAGLSRSKASDWSRKASNGSATRIGASAPAGAATCSRSGAPGATSAGLSSRSGWALTPVIGALSRAASRFSAAALSPTSRWNDAVGERRRQAAPLLDVLEERPALVGERLGQGFEPAGPGRRIGDEAEIGFAQKDKLAVAGETPREAVRKAERRAYAAGRRRCRRRRDRRKRRRSSRA